jgi:hypothetical protein
MHGVRKCQGRHSASDGLSHSAYHLDEVKNKYILRAGARIRKIAEGDMPYSLYMPPNSASYCSQT